MVGGRRQGVSRRMGVDGGSTDPRASGPGPSRAGPPRPDLSRSGLSRPDLSHPELSHPDPSHLGRSRPGLPGPPLTGRRRELRAAREALHTGGAVLLSGPAGVGLTAVATVLAAEAAESGATVLRCAPARAERGLPCAGLGTLLAGLPPGRLDALLADLAEPTAAALRAGLLRGLPPKAGVDRLALGLGLLELLRALAAAGGVLLLVDGLPWLDGPSAAALGFALRRTGESEGVRLLATARDDGAAVTDGAASADGAPCAYGAPDTDGAGQGRWWEVCPPGTVELRLPPLPPTAVAELLAHDLGGPLPVALLRDVQRVAAGNPRHALDLARAGFRLGPAGPHGVPRALRAEVLDRVRPLGEVERRLLLLAAVATRPTLAELGAALGRFGDSAGLGDSASLGNSGATGLLRLLEAPCASVCWSCSTTPATTPTPSVRDPRSAGRDRRGLSPSC